MVRLTIEIEVEDMVEALSNLQYINDTLQDAKITEVEIVPVDPVAPYTWSSGSTITTGADNT